MKIVLFYLFFLSFINGLSYPFVIDGMVFDKETLSWKPVGEQAQKEEEEMMADLGNHLPRRIAYALYPTGMPVVKEGEVLLKPENLILLGSGGAVTWD